METSNFLEGSRQVLESSALQRQNSKAFRGDLQRSARVTEDETNFYETLNKPICFLPPKTYTSSLLVILRGQAFNISQNTKWISKYESFNQRSSGL